MKKLVLIIGIILIAVFAFWKMKPQPVTKTPVKSAIACQALQIASPWENVQVTKNFTVIVIVDNRNPKCHWNVFEAQAGNVEIKDSDGKLVGNGVLRTTENWMTNSPVSYSSNITIGSNKPHGKLLLIIKEENPNGTPGKTVSESFNY